METFELVVDLGKILDLIQFIDDCIGIEAPIGGKLLLINPSRHQFLLRLESLIICSNIKSTMTVDKFCEIL